MFQSENVLRVLLVVTVVTLLWVVLVHQPQGQVVVIQLTSQSVQELQGIVQQQKKQLDYMNHNPKIVYRCLEDEPRIWYPK